MSTITATADPTNLPPRVALSFDFSSLTPDPTTATLLRNDPDGQQRAVRLTEPASLVAGVWSGYDYESPFGLAVTYTATSTSPPDTVTSTAVTLTVADPWIRHPGVPSLSVKIPATRFRKDSLATRARTTSRATFMPIGRSMPVVITSGARSSPVTEMTIRTDTDPELSAVWDLIEDESILLLDIPPAMAWGVTHEYISIGDVTEARVGDWGANPRRWFSLPYVVVDRPAGGLQAQFTYADVLAAHSTYTQVKTRYNTYANLLANQRNGTS